MLKVYVMWRGMWRTVYAADGWTLAAHAILALLLSVVAAVLLR